MKFFSKELFKKTSIFTIIAAVSGAGAASVDVQYKYNKLKVKI